MGGGKGGGGRTGAFRRRVRKASNYALWTQLGANRADLSAGYVGATRRRLRTANRIILRELGKRGQID